MFLGVTSEMWLCKKTPTTKEGISQSVSIRDRERLCIGETEYILEWLLAEEVDPAGRFQPTHHIMKAFGDPVLYNKAAGMWVA